jgi:hypothetical protein
MMELSKFVAEMQREAAALPTGQLRVEIQVSLDILEDVMDHFRRISPEASEEDMISAMENMMCTALVTVLYVRELSRRPTRRFASVRLSFN